MIIADFYSVKNFRQLENKLYITTIHRFLTKHDKEINYCHNILIYIYSELVARLAYNYFSI